jgi:GT2 family glycosyltransferase
MAEIASLIRAALDDLGFNTALLQHQLPAAVPGTVDIVVAPHEFFPLFPDVSEEECLEAAARSVLVTVEQPATSWFPIGSRYAKVARLVFDINELGVAEHRATGVSAHRLPLGYHPSWDAWRGSLTTPREHDVVYMGSLTAERERTLVRLAPTLASRRSLLFVHDGSVPVTEEAPNFVIGKRKFELLAATRFILNLHRSKVPYFEWHRLLPALANGCVVITEPAALYAPLVPFEHFFAADTDELGPFIEMLDGAEELRARVAAAAYEFVRSELSQAALLRPLLPMIEAAAHPGRTRRPRLSATDRLPRPGGPVRPAGSRFEPADPIHAALKTSLVNQAILRREVERLACRLEHGTDQRLDVVDTPGFEAAAPDVSVVLPLHNYQRFVDTAMRSVVASTGVEVELVVMDDHSTDGSRAIVEKVMADVPESAIRLVSLHANRGVAAMRNLALTHARSESIFYLDADNYLYPSGLQRLHAALSCSSAGFAYGILAGFGDRERLVSTYPWDVHRLIRGPYIDMMALFRRSALDAAGGLSEEIAALGWEDYDLQLRLAARGYDAVFVPEFVGAYRIHRSSRTAIVNLDVHSLFEALRERHPSLPWAEAWTA